MMVFEGIPGGPMDVWDGVQAPEEHLDVSLRLIREHFPLKPKAIIDHMLSLALFVAMMAEFITVQRAATSTFLILLALSFVDVIGGLTIPNRTARRAIEIEEVDRLSPG